MTDNEPKDEIVNDSAIHALKELKKAFRGFDWSNQTHASQNALIRAISLAIAHGYALDEERRKAKAR
jgi:hypothetical protein